MALGSFTVVAAQYESEEDALGDYDAVADVYRHSGLLGSFDAAVITRQSDSKVKIVRRAEDPVDQGAAEGLLFGLAFGATLALFPAIGIVAGLVGGAAAGAGAGALAGHVSAGISRSDLKELGETLDEGASGLVVVASAEMQGRVQEAVKKATRVTTAELQANVEVLKKEMEAR